MHHPTSILGSAMACLPRGATAAFVGVSVGLMLCLSLPLRAQEEPLTDLNKANETDLIDLKGIGPAKAKAILAYRTEHGPFKHPLDLRKVHGIGASTYKNLCHHIVVVKLRGCDANGNPPLNDMEIVEEVGDGRINLNVATAKELEVLPGIGPSKARAIVKSRTTDGFFETVEGLERIRGLGPKTVAKLHPFVRTTFNLNYVTRSELLAFKVSPASAGKLLKFRTRKKRFSALSDIDNIKMDAKSLEQVKRFGVVE